MELGLRKAGRTSPAQPQPRGLRGKSSGLNGSSQGTFKGTMEASEELPLPVYVHALLFFSQSLI